MSASLVGSEMCIRDRIPRTPPAAHNSDPASGGAAPRMAPPAVGLEVGAVSYTHLTLPTICSV
eukprot:1099995-Alexandrium_andersonii.AAC.1